MSRRIATWDRSLLPAADFEFVVLADTHYMIDPGDGPVDPGRGAPPPNHNRQATGETVRWRVPDGWPMKPVA